jgi:hypothetical protein
LAITAFERILRHNKAKKGNTMGKNKKSNKEVKKVKKDKLPPKLV